MDRKKTKKIFKLKRSIAQLINKITSIQYAGWDAVWDFFGEWSVVGIRDKTGAIFFDPITLANEIMMITRNDIVDRADKQRREAIEEAVNDLKRNIKAIPETVKPRDRLIQTTQKLERELKELNMRHGQLKEEVYSMNRVLISQKQYDEDGNLESDQGSPTE